MATLGLDEDDAIAAAGTIEGSGVLQHRHLLYVGRHDIAQHIEEIAAVQHRTVTLHVELYAVDDDKRLRISIQ